MSRSGCAVKIRSAAWKWKPGMRRTTCGRRRERDSAESRCGRPERRSQENGIAPLEERAGFPRLGLVGKQAEDARSAAAHQREGRSRAVQDFLHSQDFLVPVEDD